MLPPMVKKIAALIFIYLCTAVAWVILGGTIEMRTRSSQAALTGRVASTWGSAQEQSPPAAVYQYPVTRTETTRTNEGRTVTRSYEETVTAALPLTASAIDVALNLEHRQKGLLWYATYRVEFAGVYTFTNDTGKDRTVDFSLPFPAEKAIYDGLQAQVEGQAWPYQTANSAATVRGLVPAGQSARFKVFYRSQGLGTWKYSFGKEIATIRNFRLTLKTNFPDIDFPDNSLSPSGKREIPGGWELTWAYQSLISGYQIAMTLPEKLQPGPLAGQISFFAPVSLLFFFFVMLIITTLRGIDLHPMNYFFLAAAFFAFHLLLAYLVDHISIHWSFAISSLVSLFLVISYLRIVAGPRFALVEAGGAQLLYLVLFSYAFFFKGFTGLTVTIGSIATLFVLMQVTARVRWSEAGKPPRESGDVLR
jgi:inner membrane protein involved in colicin E2 resistance